MEPTFADWLQLGAFGLLYPFGILGLLVVLDPVGTGALGITWRSLPAMYGAGVLLFAAIAFWL